MDTTEFQEKDEDEDNILPDSTITDKDLNILYPKQIKKIMSQYKSNNEFRSCVDNQIPKIDRYTILKYSSKNLY